MTKKTSATKTKTKQAPQEKSPDVPSDSGDPLLLPLAAAKRKSGELFEKVYLQKVLVRAKGSVSEAARLSGLDRTNFRRLLQRHGLKPTEVDPIDPDRADAAVEVLQAVWLSEKHFDLESEIVQKDGRPVVDQDAEECLWVTVRLHVPRLDVDTWIDRTHLDHPDNQEDDEENDA